jgi:DNA-binding protein H-NS
MRKPRDFDAQLKALNEKAKQLKDRKIRQYGDLVIATGADALDIETLAGALVLITEQADAARKESWRRKGEAFFRKQQSSTTQPPQNDAQVREAAEISHQPFHRRTTAPGS